MRLTRKDPFTGKTHTKQLDITSEELVRWEKGELAQDVWPHLEPSDREFIMTGIVEWPWQDSGVEE